MNNFLYVLIALFPVIGYAQQNQYYEVFQKINEALMPSDHIIAYDMNFSYYEKIEGLTPDTKLHVKTIIGQGYYWMKAENYEFFGNENWDCKLDHEAKTIIMTRKKTGQIQVPISTFSDFASLADENGLDLKSFDPGKGYEGLRFEAPEYSNTTIDILYTPDDYFLHKTILKVAVEGNPSHLEFNNCKIVGEYTNYKQLKGHFPYSLKRYAKKEGKSYVPSRAYNEYDLKLQKN